MMGKLFCLSVFGRKSKASKTLACTDVGLDTTLGKKDLLSNFSVHAVGPAVMCDLVVTSPTCKDDPLFNACKGNPSREFPSCKSELKEDEQGSFGFLSLSYPEIKVGSCGLQKEALGIGTVGHDMLLRHDEKLGSDMSIDSINKSDSEAVESERTRPSCEDSGRPLGDRDASLATYADGQVLFGKLSENGTDIVNSIEEVRRENIFHYSPDKAISSIRYERMAWDDEILAGHLSDPGVFQSEEMQSLNGLHDDGSAMQSLVLEGSILSQNLESYSHVSKSATSGDAIENLSVETCGHCSEPTYHIMKMEEQRLNSSSNVARSSSMSRHTTSLSQELFFKSLPIHDGTQGDQIEDPVAYGCDVGDMGRFPDLVSNEPKLEDTAHETEVIGEGIFTIPQSPGINVCSAESSLRRVKEWINAIQQPDTSVYEEAAAFAMGSNEEVGDAQTGLPDTVTMDRELASAAVRSLTAYSTVAHISGIGLQEVPSLGVFNCLKSLNLSANCITRIHAGSLPQSLHTLDLSRNRISQVEGFRDLTRLRVLNLSYNRISRIGHGLANCTLIKELYLAGNKIAEVEGLHRLLKLSVLNLSHNKVATSKAVGQLAANYNSLLALNLLGNPILVNVGEDQLRKLVTSLTPHVTYLNKQPIKAVSVREAVVDTVARAALGTSHRNNKSSGSRSLRKVAGVQSSNSAQKKPPSRRAKDSEKRPESSSGKSSKQAHHHRRSQHHGDSGVDRGLGKEHGHFSGTPLREHLLRSLAFDSRNEGMLRSRSDGALQE